MKNVFISVLMLVSVSAFAAFKKPADVRYELNNSPAGQSVQLGTQLVDKKVHVLRARYDFAKQGGAVGAVNLLDVDGKSAVLPHGAIVQDCVIHTVTAPVSAGSATLAFNTGYQADDLKAATGKASFTNDGLLACIPVGSVATSIKIPDFTSVYSAGYTAAYYPQVTIGTAALTAGKVDVLIKYLISN